MNKRSLIIGAAILAVCLILVGLLGQLKRLGKGKSRAASLYTSALTSESKGEVDQALKLYQELINEFPQEKQAAEAWYKLGEIYAKGGLWQKAKEAYAKIISDFPGFGQISDVENKLWDANTKVLFSPLVTDEDIAYKVVPGNTLSRIARKYNTTVELIMRSNKLRTYLIRPGQRLKVSAAKYSVIVDKSQNLLTLKANDEIFKVYSVATGKYNYSTPNGTFTIIEKLKNPDWYKSGEGVIPAASPKNVLGSRWLGLSERQYGIHGGASQKDLGTQATDGCVRMTNSDVEELFTILPRGTEVMIVD